MKNNYKKILILIIFVFLTTLLGYYIFKSENYKSSMIYYKDIATTPENNKVQEEKWSTYHDEGYGFSVNYKPGLDVETIHNHKLILSNDKELIINGGVNFSLGDGPGVSIEIFNDNQFSSLDDWINKQNKEKLLSHYIIDSNQNIDGYQSSSIKEVGNNGENEAEYNNVQITAFFRNKQLFIIFTGNSEDDNKILNSFKFDK